MEEETQGASKGRRAARLAATATVGVTTLTTLIGAFLLCQWLPQLPNPAAVHWGVGGRPDGFAPPGVYWILLLVAGWLLPVLMVLPWGRFRRPQPSPAYRSVSSPAYSPTGRFMAATAVWLNVLMVGLAIGAVGSQRGLTTADLAPNIYSVLAAGFAASTVAAVGMYFVLPKPIPSQWRGQGQKVAPVKLEPGQTVAWTSQATSSLWLIVPVLLAAGLTLVLGVFTGVVYLLGTAGLLLLMLAMAGAFRVSVGAQGLLVRSYLGWPRLRVPLDQIDAVRVVDVEPFQEWGGWGWRSRPGGTGIVTRRGPGLEVRRTNNRILVVTAEDSPLGAAVLQALVDREGDNGVGAN